jgi:hypothetical protein
MTADEPVYLNAVQRGGPPAFTVADEEARVRSLPRCAIVPVRRETLAPVALRVYAATIWLPPDAVEDTEVDSDTTVSVCQGWEWPTGESLSLQAHRDRELPGVYTLTVASPGVTCLEVAGRPMRVRRYAPGAPEWRGEGYAAEVAGFLDDRTSFWALARGPRYEQCEYILAAVATLSTEALE